MCWSLSKIKSYEISGQIFCLISSFLRNRRLQVILDGKSSQEYSNNAGVSPFLLLHFSYYTLMTFLMIWDIAIYADDTTLF